MDVGDGKLCALYVLREMIEDAWDLTQGAEEKEARECMVNGGCGRFNSTQASEFRLRMLNYVIAEFRLRIADC